MSSSLFHLFSHKLRDALLLALTVIEWQTISVVFSSPPYTRLIFLIVVMAKRYFIAANSKHIVSLSHKASSPRLQSDVRVSRGSGILIRAPTNWFTSEMFFCECENWTSVMMITQCGLYLAFRWTNQLPISRIVDVFMAFREPHSVCLGLADSLTSELYVEWNILFHSQCDSQRPSISIPFALLFLPLQRLDDVRP